ncbi:hypothetical protein V8E52_010486 [Russula decolorans]
MQVNPHCELYRVLPDQVNKVHLNGSGTHNHSPYQSEAMENIHYWHDGTVPYCPSATAWQPMDDNLVPMNVPGYFNVDNSGAIHQLINIHHSSHVGFQESVPHSYAPQYWELPYTTSPNRAQVSSNLASPCSTVTSPCTSRFSTAGGDSVPLIPHIQHHSHSNDAICRTHLQLNLPSLHGPPSSSVNAVPSPTPHTHSRQHLNDAINESELHLTLAHYPSSTPQMASPVFTQSPQHQQEEQDRPPLETAAPTTPPSGPSSPELVLTPSQDLVGRRAPVPAPKRRRIKRAVPRQSSTPAGQTTSRAREAAKRREALPLSQQLNA